MRACTFEHVKETKNCMKKGIYQEIYIYKQRIGSWTLSGQQSGHNYLYYEGSVVQKCKLDVFKYDWQVFLLHFSPQKKQVRVWKRWSSFSSCLKPRNQRLGDGLERARRGWGADTRPLLGRARGRRRRFPRSTRNSGTRTHSHGPPPSAELQPHQRPLTVRQQAARRRKGRRHLFVMQHS